MADLLTVYDDDTFFDCTVCDKRIRGDTLYKLHLTSSLHLKKEKTLAAQGKIPKPPPLPEWTDIKQYLEYLKLDEPIIGLGSLEQIPDLVNDDGKPGLKYKCRVCNIEMDLHNAVGHVIGRKHRQKYLEQKRPDLVTWRNTTQQPGLVARFQAKVVEKQEGWGTPVPLEKPQKKPRNVGKGNDLKSTVRGRNPRTKSTFVKDIHKQSYLDEHGRPCYTGEKDVQYGRPHPSENRHQRPYKETNIQGRFFQGDDYSEREEHARHHVDQGGRSMSHSREDYEEANLGKGQYSRGYSLKSRDYDVQENIYQEDVPRNIFNDRDIRIHSAAQHHGETEYLEQQMEGRMYAAYEERGSGMEVMSKYSRSFHDEERRENVREFTRRMWEESNEMQGYPQRLDPRDIPRAYSHEPVPAKKKKKSRFSDATAEEIALAHMRHSQEFIHKEKQRGAPNQAKSPLFNNPVMESRNASRVYPHPENVLDVLSDIQIENLGEAKFLKEKLCTVLKEFQANKTAKTGGHTSQFASEQRRDAHDKDLRDDPDGMYLENRGFQEVRRYEDDPRSVQESRKYEEDPRAVGEIRRYEDDPRAFGEVKRYEDDPRAFGEVKRYEDDPRAFGEVKRYEDDPRAFGEVKRYEDDPRAFGEVKRYEDDPRAFGEVKRYEDDPRAFGEVKRYEDDPRAFGEVKRYEDVPRAFGEVKRYEDDPRPFVEVKQSEDDPRAFGEVKRYEDDPRAFGEVKRYEDEPRAFGEVKRYEDDPRAFGEVKRYKDDPRSPRESRRYENDSRDYREARRFDSYPSDFQEVRQFADDPRGLQKTRLQENPRDFPERRGYEADLGEEAGHYEEYSRATKDSLEGPRSIHETRYYDDDFRGFVNVDSERKWDHQRRHSSERFENSGREDIESGFQESFGKPPMLYKPTSLLDDTRMFAGRGQQRSHQNDRQPGDELYDPFQPSSSPPPEMTHSTSLDKIASTLLELVARR
ncbi:uncharacterized protein LOC127425345 isoform X8 [Myxocyprinus asiaticus]|uniref:uncharacterized protein LOC127425345 isoform X8 n=1 Tax=Myxocyprinus asiaticus TaxID=70543 RepID=UPI002222C049|nr:uncharacterized protein LOC127425345 isoform X8 [Myxocyprinus asiaticus]